MIGRAGEYVCRHCRAVFCWPRNDHAGDALFSYWKSLHQHPERDPRCTWEPELGHRCVLPKHTEPGMGGPLHDFGAE